jgi:hypothetical protein
MPYKIRVQRKTGKWEDEVGLIIHTGSPPRRDDVIEANLHDGKIKARVTNKTTLRNKEGGTPIPRIDAAEI